jgi:hypothetical protein
MLKRRQRHARSPRSDWDPESAEGGRFLEEVSRRVGFLVPRGTGLQLMQVNKPALNKNENKKSEKFTVKKFG